ncbi:MAG TPA: tetratricopeptide repeat protein [Chitinophagaceae bacterium]|nr:tetratricopeptide repeat protein [Chitinophagaceae bacterium]
MKKLFFIYTCLFTLGTQAQLNTDSLKNLLVSAKEDSSKVLLLCLLSFNSWDTDSCLKWDNEALKLARKINFTIGEAKSLNQFGNDLLGSANYSKALEYYLQALKINERISDLADIAVNYSNISLVYIAEQDYKTALVYMFKAVEIRKKFNDNRLRIQYANIGMAYEKMNQLDSALVYYQMSYAIFNSISDKFQLPDVLNGLGNVHSRLGNIELAFTFYRMGVAAADPGSIYFAQSYYGLANLFKQTGRMDSCLFYAKNALETSGKKPEMVATAALLLSELYEGKDDKQSFYYYKLAIKTRDSIYNTEKQLQIKNLTYNEQERQKELANLALKNKEERKQNIQYAAIAIALITFVILFLLLSRSIIVKTKFIEFFGVLGLLAVFEFINLFIHPYLSHATNDSPVLMLAVLIAIGALLIPLHHKLEKWITKIMVEKNKKIRLEAAKKTIQQLEG